MTTVFRDPFAVDCDRMANDAEILACSTNGSMPAAFTMRCARITPLTRSRNLNPVSSLALLAARQSLGRTRL